MANAELKAKMTMDISQFQSQLKRAEGAESQHRDRRLQAWKKFGIGVAAAGGAAIAAGSAFVSNAGAQADALFNLSEATTLTVEQLQALEFAFKQNGVSSEELSSMLGKLTEFQGKVADNSKEVQDTMQQLGITQKDAFGPTSAFFELIIQKSEKAGNKAEILKQAFGRGALVRASRTFSEIAAQGLDQFTQAAIKAGQVVSGPDLMAIDKVSDKVDALASSLKKGVVHLANFSDEEKKAAAESIALDRKQASIDAQKARRNFAKNTLMEKAKELQQKLTEQQEKIADETVNAFAIDALQRVGGSTSTTPNQLASDHQVVTKAEFREQSEKQIELQKEIAENTKALAALEE